MRAFGVPQSKWDADGLTERQRAVLVLIAKGIAAGLCPTLREIGASLRITSTNGVNDHLRALERKDLIVRRDLLTRSIRLTERGRLVVAGAIPLSSRVAALSAEDQREVEALVASIEARRAERVA